MSKRLDRDLRNGAQRAGSAAWVLGALGVGAAVAQSPRIMELGLASIRAIHLALHAWEEGELRLAEAGQLAVQTAKGWLRFIDGTCFAAMAGEVEAIGAELVGWLEEMPNASGVGAWWRPGSRAVLRTAERGYCVTAPTSDLVVDGDPACGGRATHSARLFLARGGPAMGVTRAAPLPRPELATAFVGDPADLRARGTWSQTSVMPWNL